MWPIYLNLQHVIKFPGYLRGNVEIKIAKHQDRVKGRTDT